MEDCVCSIVEFLAKQGHPVKFQALYNRIKQRFKISKEQLKWILLNNSQHFQIAQDRETTVCYSPNLEICEAYCTRQGCMMSHPLCSKLHVCKFYILNGNCQFNRMCKYGHDLSTAHNISVLKDNYLNKMALSDVRNILCTFRQNMAVAKPKICRFYNTAGNSCRYTAAGKRCPCLHLCRSYISGSCKFGSGCLRSHDLKDPVVKHILQKHGINIERKIAEILSDLRDMYEDDDDVGSVNSQPAFR